MVPTFIRRYFERRPNFAKIVSNVGWLTLDKIIRIGVGVFVSVWIARYLGPKGFGVLGYVTAFVGVFGIIGGFGLRNVVIHDFVTDTANEKLTLGTAAALSLGGAILAYGLAVLVIAWARGDDSLVRMAVAIAGLSLVFKATDVASYWFEAHVQSKYVVWASNVVFMVFVGVKVWLILTSATLITFFWVILAESAASAIALVSIFTWKGPRLRGICVSSDRALVLLRESWPLAVSGVAVVIYMKIDLIMLGQMMGDDSVGIYNAAVRISEVWYFIPIAIVGSVFPAIVEAKRLDESLYLARLQKLYDLMVLLSLAIAVPMTFVSNALTTLIYGVEYRSAGPVLAIHTWASIFVFLGVASTKWIIVEKRQMLSLQRTVIGAVSNVALNIVLIPKYGSIGAAWATVAAYSLAGFFVDVIQRKTREMFYMKVRSLNPLGAIRRLSDEFIEVRS